MIFSGGSSVGERDLIVDLIARRGEVVFHGIAVKPGKPTLFATVDYIRFWDARKSNVMPLERLHPAGAVSPRDGSIAHLRTAHRQRKLGKRIVSQAGRHQFYTIRLRDGARIQRSRDRAISPVFRKLTGISRFLPISTVEEGVLVDVTLFELSNWVIG